MKIKTQRVAVVGAALVLVGAGASAALASSNPNNKQYGNGLVAAKTPKPPAASSAPIQQKSGGTLPFTGLDLALVVAAGAAAVGGGVGLRKLGRKQTTTRS